MLNRQRALLAMLDEAGGVASRLELMKWAFLLHYEAPTRGGTAFYQFVPYRFGPCSFCVYNEVSALVRDDLIEEPSNREWRLRPAARRIAQSLDGAVRRDIGTIVGRFPRRDVTELIDYVYERHPWFTLNSERGSRIGRPAAGAAVYTAGYEGLLVDGFLNGLLESGIRRVVDVRRNPISRRYGFHKSTLSRLCSHVGIEYSHFPELGIASDQRRGLSTPADYFALFGEYERSTLPMEHASVLTLASSMRERPSVLVCMEGRSPDVPPVEIGCRRRRGRRSSHHPLGVASVTGRFERTRVLITVMTYPHPSSRYTELVCTAGITDGGEWVRLYPIDYRYRLPHQQFHKYQWIDVDLAPRGRGGDRRRESRAPQLDSIKIVGAPLSTSRGWAARREIIDNLPHRTLNECARLYEQERVSLSVVRPARVLDIEIRTSDPEWKPEWQAELAQLRLFEPPPKPLRKLPYSFHYVFECEGSEKPHRAMIEDWELGVLFLKEAARLGSDDKAAESVKRQYLTQMCAPERDTRFFMGTRFPYNTGLVLGVFWPPRSPQGTLFA